MTATISDLLALSLMERLQLVEDLWDSIAAESAGLPLTEAQREEVDRRLAEHDRNPASALPWEEVQARLARRFA
jgi:putative addiction module component (TIGR02574 family)